MNSYTRFRVETDYLEHDSGRKFYENVVIVDESYQCMLIKRSGVISAKMGGGRSSYSDGNWIQVSRLREATLRDKRTIHPTRGQYLNARRPAFGLHELIDKSLSSTDLYRAIERHYSDLTFDAICDFFNLGVMDAAMLSDDDEDVVESDGVTDEERGVSWGSW